MSQSPQPSPADRFAIHELIALYGHLIDERQFSRLGEIFTADATFDLTGYDGTSYHGLPAIQAMMLASNEHPIAHHATNVVIIEVVGRRDLDTARPEFSVHVGVGNDRNLAVGKR